MSTNFPPSSTVVPSGERKIQVLIANTIIGLEVEESIAKLEAQFGYSSIRNTSSEDNPKEVEVSEQSKIQRLIGGIRQLIKKVGF